MRRIEIVEDCEHGYWGVPHGSTMHDLDGHEPFCPGGSRQPLTVFPPEAVKAASSAIRNLRWEDTTSEAMAEAALAVALKALAND